jgi:hypothetical protein
MTTTSLFVELIVIGVGALGWLTMALLAVFGYGWVDFSKFSSLAGLVPALAVTYVLGIVVDRVADQVFQPMARRLQSRSFATREDYERAQDLVYVKSPLRDLIEYNRSRLRICRGWVVNCVAGLVSLNALVWSQLPQDTPRMKLAVTGTVLLLAVGVGASNAWYQLCIVAYQRLAGQARIVEDEVTRPPRLAE